MKLTWILGAALLVLGLLLALYGVFALTFEEGGGATYVTLMGQRFDAHGVGAASLVIGLAAITTESCSCGACAPDAPAAS